MNPDLLGPAVLAYIGDSFYEHEIRTYLVEEGLTNLNDLHKRAVKFTSGKRQALIIRYFLNEEILTPSEIRVFKRGRNISGSSKRNLKLTERHDSTGFETLIGYLSLKNKDRAKELINLAINYIKVKDDKS